MQDHALWTRIAGHRFDEPDAEAGFATRLAEAEGWAPSFAAKAISEYLRFVYLTQLGAGAVTPSPVVDRVWHAHLTHTRNYWDRFCGDTLGRNLHHEPGAGPADAARHEAQYRLAHRLYAREFGAAPPADIWPAPDADPAAAPAARRSVDKMRLAGVFRIAAVGFAVATAYFEGSARNGFAVAMLLSILVTFALDGTWTGRGGGSSCGANCGSCGGDGGSGCGGGD